MNAFDLTGKAGGFKVHAQARWSESRVALFGASGSGKSTILEAMIGLRREIHGEVRFGGRRIDTLPTRERGIGWTPQDAALWPHMSAGENIVFAARGGRPADGVIEEIARDLEIETLLDRAPESLSGGERQRVAIARALASQPRVLLFDEPLSAVDRPARTRILPRLRAWPERLGAPLVWVTHDPLEVMTIADRVLLIDDGHITASGDPRSVFFSPAAFGSLLALTAENIFDVLSAEASEGVIRVTTANGAVLDMAHVPGFSSPKKVAIRAEDILIAMSRPEAISAQNILTGKIVGLDAAGEQVHVLIAAGERWTAKVTRKAVQRLGLRLGADAHLVIKAHAVLAAG